MQIKIGASAQQRRLRAIAYADVLCITRQDLTGQTAVKWLNGAAVGGATPNYTNTIVAVSTSNGLENYVELTDVELAALSEGDWPEWRCAAVTGQFFSVPTQIVNKYVSDVTAKTDNLPASPASEGNVTNVGLAVAAVAGAMALNSTVAKEATLTRALGLVLENHVEDDIVRDANGLKIASNIYCYDSSAHATAHDKVTGLTAVYATTVTYASGHMTRFKVVRTT